MPPKRRSKTQGGSASKRRMVTIDDDDDDESLNEILEQIKQQEESEALARKLEHAGPSRRGDDEVLEDDEAMAIRLAREWATEDREQTVHQNSSATNNPPEDSPDDRLREHRDLFVGTRKCSKCNISIPSPRGYVAYYSAQTPPLSLLHLLHACCPSCKTNHCRGCFSVLPCPPSCKGKHKEKGSLCAVVSCCAEVRAIALFEALGAFDRHYIGERTTSDLRSKAVTKTKRGSASIGPGGTGYGTGSCNELQDLPSHRRGRGTRTSGSLEEDAMTSSLAVASSDELIVRALNTITLFLPSPYSESPQVYDMLPHMSIYPLLTLSQLPELLGILLRNDSVTDWTSRSDVYNAMLVLLRRMADCELTLEVLISSLHEKFSGGIEEWMWGDVEIEWSKSDGKLIKNNALYTHFQKLTKQCEAFLSGAAQMLEGSDAQDGDEDMEVVVKGTSLCGEIIVARDDLERAMQVLGRDPPNVTDTSPTAIDTGNNKGKGKNKGKGPDLTIEMERRYASECERLAFDHIPFPQDEGSYTTYNYAASLKDTAAGTRNPKDRLHLIKELAVMSTSLPPGVWVRVDEVRNDALKIMIAGPEGTPYAGGLFEFDCFLPLQYPHQPPQMHLRTTGGGRVRFNPNLYNSGKVCLSLLGTWHGRPEEQWSSKSTLLQVLISIQSMILVELPYFNEPGYGKANPLSKASIEYNKNITVHTMKWAMIEWFKDEQKDGIWADVIASHFTIRAEKIRKCIEDWAKMEPRIHQHSASGTNMDLLHEFDMGIRRIKT